MKFLLVALNSKYIHTNLAIRSLQSFAGALSGHVECREYTINHNADAILQDIYESRPDVIGFSCYIWNCDYVKFLTEALSKVLPQVPMWLGGPEVSFYTEAELQAFPTVKGIMIGEGEEAFRQLLSHYVEGQPALSDIAGLSYRENGKLFCNPLREPMDLGAVPFPYGPEEDFSHKIAYYESSRGCPFSCSYCLSSVDKRLRFRPMALVKRELAYFLEKQVPQVKFVDRTFNCKKEHAMEIWQLLLDHDNGVTNFHFEIAADLIDEEMLALLSRMRPGQVQLETGVQSVNPDTLAAIRRRMDFEKVARVTRQIKGFGNIHQHLDLIVGLPYEDYESFGRSFDAVYALRPDQLQLGFLKVLKGTRMCEQAEEYGLLYHGTAPYEVLATRWLSYGDIVRLKRIEETVETYYNSGQFSAQIAYLERFYPSAFSMYEALSRWMEEAGGFQEGSSRAEKCRRLYAFACEQLPAEAETFRTLAAYDLYSREKCKSRPDFLADQAPHKQALSGLLSEEGRAHKLSPVWKEESYRSLLHHLHGEALTVDVETLLKTGEKKNGLWYYIFDYGSRDPLTKNAAVQKLCGPYPAAGV